MTRKKKNLFFWLPEPHVHVFFSREEKSLEKKFRPGSQESKQGPTRTRTDRTRALYSCNRTCSKPTGYLANKNKSETHLLKKELNTYHES